MAYHYTQDLEYYGLFRISDKADTQTIVLYFESTLAFPLFDFYSFNG